MGSLVLHIIHVILQASLFFAPDAIYRTSKLLWEKLKRRTVKVV